MKFGILATPIWDKTTEPAIQLREHRELVELARDLGFDMVVAGQHFLGTELRYYQPVPYLTHLSQFAPNMEMVIGIILLSLVNPIETAEQVATLDAVTGGKAILGLGLGYSDHEFKAFGIQKSSRVRRFEENLSLIKTLWSGEEVNFQGQNSLIENITPCVLPVRKPRPPIWIGGQGEQAVRRAARLSDAWYAPPFVTHKGMVRLRNIFLEESATYGMPLNGDFPLRRELMIAPSIKKARQMALKWSEARYKTYLKWGLGKKLDRDTAGFGSQEQEAIDSRFILGTADICAEKIKEMQVNLGMTHFMYKAHWPGVPHSESMKQLESFGANIIPQVRRKN